MTETIDGCLVTLDLVYDSRINLAMRHNAPVDIVVLATYESSMPGAVDNGLLVRIRVIRRKV